MKEIKVIVIGGGSSGLVSAVIAECQHETVLVVDHEYESVDITKMFLHRDYACVSNLQLLEAMEHCHRPTPTHLDNQSFIQQKMQGKRRTY